MQGGGGASSGALGAIAGIAIAIIFTYLAYRGYLKWKARVQPLAKNETPLEPPPLTKIPKLDMAKVRKQEEDDVAEAPPATALPKRDDEEVGEEEVNKIV